MPEAPRVSLNHCATVLGLSWRKAQKVVARLVMFPPDEHGLYDARVLDLLRAMRGQPHRALEPVHQDWLARYMEEKHHAATRTQEPGPAGT